MKLILTDEAGTAVVTWDVEDDFGDVTKSMPLSLLTSAVRDAVRAYYADHPEAQDKLQAALQGDGESD